MADQRRHSQEPIIRRWAQMLAKIVSYPQCPDCWSTRRYRADPLPPLFDRRQFAHALDQHRASALIDLTKTGLAQKGAEVLVPDPAHSNSPSAPRVRRHRQRRQRGLQCVTLELHDSEIVALVRRGRLVAPDSPNDLAAVKKALYAIIEYTLGGPP